MPERLCAAELERILRKEGFLCISQKGSHKKWKNAKTGKQVIIPFHKGKDLPVGTMMSIIKGSGIEKVKCACSYFFCFSMQPAMYGIILPLDFRIIFKLPHSDC